MKMTMDKLLSILLLVFVGSLGLADEKATPSRKDRLQRALFAEEAEKNLTEAAAEYERLVQEYTDGRKIALSALYRLAEVRRKQERNEEAAALYKRVVAEFPESQEARMSRENLTALGIELAGVPTRIPDDPEETKELRRLMLLAKSSPERVWDEVPLDHQNKISPLSMAARRG
jgi:outer membrane protein assembly factor BamD (BamD/ComL family)